MKIEDMDLPLIYKRRIMSEGYKELSDLAGVRVDAIPHIGRKGFIAFTESLINAAIDLESGKRSADSNTLDVNVTIGWKK